MLGSPLQFSDPGVDVRLADATWQRDTVLVPYRLLRFNKNFDKRERYELTIHERYPEAIVFKVRDRVKTRSVWTFRVTRHDDDVVLMSRC